MGGITKKQVTFFVLCFLNSHIRDFFLPLPAPYKLEPDCLRCYTMGVYCLADIFVTQTHGGLQI
jgi:hypothetical protein